MNLVNNLYKDGYLTKPLNYFSYFCLSLPALFSKNYENYPAVGSALNITIAAYPSDADSIEQLINQIEKGLCESTQENQPMTLENRNFISIPWFYKLPPISSFKI